MYLASLSAPALLSHGKKVDSVGFHASQTFNVHGRCLFGDVHVSIGDERVSRGLHYFDLRWFQGFKLIASGRAGIVPLSKEDLEGMAEEAV